MPHSTSDDLARKRILLVDDEPFMLAAVGKVLTGLGFEFVERAEHGRQALDCLKAGPVDLVLTDVQMPQVNGLELTAQIRTGDAGAARGLPVIIFTSIDNDETLSSALALDVNGFLTKPAKPLTIVQRIIQGLSEQAFELREVSDYAGVLTDLDALLDGARSREATATPPPSVAHHVGLLQLRPKMTLVEDVRHPNGALLLSSGFVLQQSTINRLTEMRETLKKVMFHVVDP